MQLQPGDGSDGMFLDGGGIAEGPITGSISAELLQQTAIFWCIRSDVELRKCTDLSAWVPVFACVKRDDSKDCIASIKVIRCSCFLLLGP
ncbi:unnamed protein product [Ophioblennius macclurei]